MSRQSPNFLSSKRIWILTILFGFSIGLGIACTQIPFEKVPNANVFGLMLTLLSIIITLGVAYSFYSVFKANSEVEELRRNFRDLSEKFSEVHTQLSLEDAKNFETISVFKAQIAEQAWKEKDDMQQKYEQLRDELISKSSDLFEDTISIKIAQTFEKRNKEAEGKFRDKRFLIALKVELEAIEFLLNNLKYLSHELISSIGNKRSNIARDIDLFMSNITEKKFKKYSDFTDTYETIICKKQNILTTPGWNSVSKCEQERYEYLFKVIQRLINELIVGSFPLPISSDNEVRIKLSFFQTYLQGAKNDKENGWNDFVAKYHNSDHDSSMYIP